jgi:anti-sigma factor RsiW
MNCQEAILRLPWWLNGSLEPEERREVEDHLAACASCREALAETRLAWEVFGQHISTADLVAYAAAGEPEEPDGSDRIDPALLERHLADCPQCTAELSMVRASRLLTEHGDVPLLTRRPSLPEVPVTKRRERGWQTAALAAGLTGILAIGGWVGSVQKLHRMERAESPILRGAPVHMAKAFGVHPIFGQLSPDAVVRGAGAGNGVQTVQLPKSGEVTLLLNSPTDTTGEHAYRILDAAGKELASGGGLVPSPLQAYQVTVDAKLLPPGRYTIQLYVSSPGAANPAGMQSYPFTVQ